MTNPIRGDVELVAGGRTYTMRLTLGALAEIEHGLGLHDLSEIETRLKTIRAGDLAIVAAALLRGGGHDIAPADVMRLPVDIGAVVRAVTLAFAMAGDTTETTEKPAGPFGPVFLNSDSA